MNNTELVQNAYECFGRGDIPGLLDNCSEDIGWKIPEIENAPFAGARQGKTAVAEFFTQLSESEDITDFVPTDFVAQDDRVVVLGRSTATVRATGKTYSTDWVHVFKVSDGQITEFHEFFDNAAATRAFQRSAAA